jgi:hypothetical protein
MPQKSASNGNRNDVVTSTPVLVPGGLLRTTSTQSIHSSLAVATVPPSTQILVDTVCRFFTALARGKIDALLPLLAPSAVSVDSHGNETSLVSHWTQRLGRFDYRLTAHDNPLWEPDIVVVAHDDDRAKSVVALLKPKTDDPLVLVPIARPLYDGQPFFGNTMWFQLRQTDNGYRIVACAEDLD